MRRQLPFVLVFLFGVFMVFQFFVPHETSEWVYEFLLDWIYIIGIFALALGIWSLFKVSTDKIKNRKEGWGYAYVTLCGLFLMVAFGFTQRIGEDWGLYFLWIVLSLACLVSAMTVRATLAAGRKKVWALLALGFLAAAVIVAVIDNAWAFHFYTQEGLDNTMFRTFFNHVMMPILATMFALLAFYVASAAYRAFRARNIMASLLLIAALLVMSRFNPFIPGAEHVADASNWLMNVPNMAAQRAIVIGIGLGIVGTAMKVILGVERGYMGKG
jgi:hypothetical protein